MFLDVNVNFSLQMECLQRAFHHSPRGIAAVRGHARMGTAERDVGGGRAARRHGYPFVEREGLVHGGELVETIRTQRADRQAQIDLGMRPNAGGHR